MAAEFPALFPLLFTCRAYTVQGRRSYQSERHCESGPGGLHNKSEIRAEHRLPLTLFLVANCFLRENQVLHAFIRTGNAQLFGNVAMKTVLDFKWKAYAQRLFMQELFLFLLWLAMFTTFTVFAAASVKEADLWAVATSGWRGAVCVLLSAILPFNSVRQLSLEYRQVRYFGRRGWGAGGGRLKHVHSLNEPQH